MEQRCETFCAHSIPSSPQLYPGPIGPHHNTTVVKKHTRANIHPNSFDKRNYSSQNYHTCLDCGIHKRYLPYLEKTPCVPHKKETTLCEHGEYHTICTQCNTARYCEHGKIKFRCWCFPRWLTQDPTTQQTLAILVQSKMVQLFHNHATHDQEWEQLRGMIIHTCNATPKPLPGRLLRFHNSSNQNSAPNNADNRSAE